MKRNHSLPPFLHVILLSYWCARCDFDRKREREKQRLTHEQSERITWQHVFCREPFSPINGRDCWALLGWDWAWVVRSKGHATNIAVLCCCVFSTKKKGGMSMWAATLSKIDGTRLFEPPSALMQLHQDASLEMYPSSRWGFKHNSSTLMFCSFLSASCRFALLRTA